MNSIILRTATRFLVTLMLLFSIFLLLRGHNEPGGGFVGGLVAAGALALYGLAYDEEATRQALRLDTRTLIGVGLAMALAAAVLPLLGGRPFLTGLWAAVPLPGGRELDLGTPLLFDLGVYVAVLGVTLTLLLPLMEE
jgi:multicomponent Na+:H+ antiporter subunit B